MEGGEADGLCEEEWREKISYTWSFKAWFKAWLGMVQGMARYGSLNDKLTMWNAWQAHHFGQACGQPWED